MEQIVNSSPVLASEVVDIDKEVRYHQRIGLVRAAVAAGVASDLNDYANKLAQATITKVGLESARKDSKSLKGLLSIVTPPYRHTKDNHFDERDLLEVLLVRPGIMSPDDDRRQRELERLKRLKPDVVNPDRLCYGERGYSLRALYEEFSTPLPETEDPSFILTPDVPSFEKTAVDQQQHVAVKQLVLETRNATGRTFMGLREDILRLRKHIDRAVEKIALYKFDVVDTTQFSPDDYQALVRIVVSQEFFQQAYLDRLLQKRDINFPEFHVGTIYPSEIVYMPHYESAAVVHPTLKRAEPSRLPPSEIIWHSHPVDSFCGYAVPRVAYK